MAVFFMYMYILCFRCWSVTSTSMSGRMLRHGMPRSTLSSRSTPPPLSYIQHSHYRVTSTRSGIIHVPFSPVAYTQGVKEMILSISLLGDMYIDLWSSNSITSIKYLYSMINLFMCRCNYEPACVIYPSRLAF